MKTCLRVDFIVSVIGQFSLPFPDCGKNVTIANGFIDFTNVSTIFGISLPIVCLEGFELTGGTSEIKCKADGEWTTSAICTLIGKIDTCCPFVEFH